MMLSRYAAPFALALLAAGPASAQPAQSPAQPAEAPPPAEQHRTSEAPAPLTVFFEEGSSVLRTKDKAVLDKASRAFNEGHPIVMILTGTSDRVGAARSNLTLSQRRATAVLAALLDRGIPADRFQILAKGETELPVPNKQGASEARNRSVAITWR